MLSHPDQSSGAVSWGNIQDVQPPQFSDLRPRWHPPCSSKHAGFYFEAVKAGCKLPPAHTNARKGELNHCLRVRCKPSLKPTVLAKFAAAGPKVPRAVTGSHAEQRLQPRGAALQLARTLPHRRSGTRGLLSAPLHKGLTQLPSVHGPPAGEAGSLPRSAGRPFCRCFCRMEMPWYVIVFFAV